MPELIAFPNTATVEEVTAALHTNSCAIVRDVLDGPPPEGPRPLGAPELMAADNAIQRLHVDRTEAVGRARHDVLAPFDRP